MCGLPQIVFREFWLPKTSPLGQWTPFTPSKQVKTYSNRNLANELFTHFWFIHICNKQTPKGIFFSHFSSFQESLQFCQKVVVYYHCLLPCMSSLIFYDCVATFIFWTTIMWQVTVIFIIATRSKKNLDWKLCYRSGTVNSKFHLIRSYCKYLATILSFHV